MEFEQRIAILEQKLEDLARVVVRQQLAMESAGTGITGLEARTNDLAQANTGHMATMTAMVDAQERIMANHGVAFRRIAELLAGLGCDVQGPELSELRRIFEMPSPDDDGNKTN